MIPLRANEVVGIFTARQNASHDYRQFSHTEYRDLRENSGDLFVDLAALEFGVAGIGRDHEMRRSFAFLTSENFFSLMGVQPVRGRFYTAEECRPNANIPVVVASYAFWKRMGGRNDFIGSNLQINGRPHTVIGVTPDGFSGVSALVAPDVWLPLGVHSSLGSAFADSKLCTIWRSQKLCAESYRTSATGHHDRNCKVASAGAHSAIQRYSAVRCRRRARVTDS